MGHQEQKQRWAQVCVTGSLQVFFLGSITSTGLMSLSPGSR